MLGCLFESLIGCLIEFIGALLFWLVLLPVYMIVSTPFILLAALFGPPGYRNKVAASYAKVLQAWRTTLEELP